MRRQFRVLIAVAAVALTSSCTGYVGVANDYPQYLINNRGEAKLPSTDGVSAYLLTPRAQDDRYEFRSWLAGPAVKWVVDFGKMLDDTFQSADVQTAFDGLRKVDQPPAAGNTLVVDVRHYSFDHFSAHVSLEVSLERGGKVVFEKVYTQTGESQFGKMYWGAGFAQKNAVQQSTKLALDEIIRELIADLNARA